MVGASSHLCMLPHVDGDRPVAVHCRDSGPSQRCGAIAHSDWVMLVRIVTGVCRRGGGGGPFRQSASRRYVAQVIATWTRMHGRRIEHPVQPQQQTLKQKTHAVTSSHCNGRTHQVASSWQALCRMLAPIRMVTRPWTQTGAGTQPRTGTPAATRAAAPWLQTP